MVDGRRRRAPWRSGRGARGRDGKRPVDRRAVGCGAFEGTIDRAGARRRRLGMSRLRAPIERGRTRRAVRAVRASGRAAGTSSASGRARARAAGPAEAGGRSRRAAGSVSWVAGRTAPTLRRPRRVPAATAYGSRSTAREMAAASVWRRAARRAGRMRATAAPFLHWQTWDGPGTIQSAVSTFHLQRTDSDPCLWYRQLRGGPAGSASGPAPDRSGVGLGKPQSNGARCRPRCRGGSPGSASRLMVLTIRVFPQGAAVGWPPDVACSSGGATWRSGRELRDPSLKPWGGASAERPGSPAMRWARGLALRSRLTPTVESRPRLERRPLLIRAGRWPMVPASVGVPVHRDGRRTDARGWPSYPAPVSNSPGPTPRAGPRRIGNERLRPRQRGTACDSLGATREASWAPTDRRWRRRSPGQRDGSRPAGMAARWPVPVGAVSLRRPTRARAPRT